MRYTLRPLTACEQEHAFKYVHDHIIVHLGDDYLWNIDHVVRVMTLYGVTRSAHDPAPILDYWDRKVRVISEMVSRFLVESYDGIAEFGLLDRARRLLHLAHHHV